MAYRDELDAARIRRDNLQREVSEIDRHVARRAELERELADAARAVDRARAKVALPLLSRVRVASPCSARWDEMKGDDRVRHCASCDKKVYDLSAVRAEEAEALLRAHGTSLCARFYRRADGTVMTADCPVGVRRVRLRNLALAGATAMMLGTSFLSIAGGAAYLVASADSIDVIDSPPIMMGEPAMDPYTAPAGGISFEPPPPDVEPPAPEGPPEAPSDRPAE